MHASIVSIRNTRTYFPCFMHGYFAPIINTDSDALFWAENWKGGHDTDPNKHNNLSVAVLRELAGGYKCNR